MAKTIRDLLGGKNLSGTIKAIRDGVPMDLLPPEFMRVTRKVTGNVLTFREVDSTRRVARQVHRGSPARQVRDIPGVRERIVQTIHNFESITHDISELTNIESPDGVVQPNGEAEIARQTEEFMRLFMNHRASAMYSVLANGTIDYDGDGNLLAPGSAGALSVDFGVPAGNKNQLDVDGTGDIIDLSWAAAGTPIHTQMKNLRRASRKLTGYPLRRAFYGENILDHFLNNTKIKELINRSVSRQDQAAAGEVPSPLLGFQWHPIYEAFFQDKDGVDVDFFGPDTVVFTPDPSPEWWEVVEGSTPVPRGLGNISADASAALADIMQVNGLFSYARINFNPVVIEQFAGDEHIPLLKVPKAIFIADVTP